MALGDMILFLISRYCVRPGLGSSLILMVRSVTIVRHADRHEAGGRDDRISLPQVVLQGPRHERADLCTIGAARVAFRWYR